MKYGKYLVGGIALSMLAATPAYAQDTGGFGYAVVGDLSVGMRDTRSTDSGEGGTTEVAIDLRGALSFKGFTGQADYRYESYSGDGEATPTLDSDAQDAFQIAGAHLGYRNPSLFHVGLFYGYTWADLPEFTDQTSWETSMYGVEAQVYLNDVTLYVQYGAVDDEASDPTEVEGVHNGMVARGVARFFVGQDSMLEAELSYADSDSYIDSGDPGEFRGWGLKGKTRILENTPLYLTAGYRGASYDATIGEDDSTMEQVFSVGVSFMFGVDNLKDNDRNGASLDLPGLPGRAHGFTELLD